MQSDEIYGIVGGKAKANDFEQFKTICGDLLAISKAHDKTPRVFCDPNTPRFVVDGAASILGAENVYDTSTMKPWSEDVWTGPKTVIPEGGIFELEMD